MSNQYVGEVRLVGFSFAPASWALCNGAIVSIASNDTLFSLIGTTYGGDGQSTFALPNLQSRIPVHQGTSNLGSTYVIGQTGGVESVTINANTYPSHNHVLLASGAQGGVGSPANNVLGQLTGVYSNQSPPTGGAMNGAVLGTYPGSSQPHDNLQPYQTLNWVIALYGIYPTQN
jgi:microcystin-dependent protein